MSEGDPTIKDTPTVARTPRRDRASTHSSFLGDDRYRVHTRLGAGGMGEVLAARDEVIGRDIAIKRMLDNSPSEEQIRRFLREARIQGTLDHPAIPPVHELAHDAEGRPYFVMKRLTGITLATVLAKQESGDVEVAKQFPRERLLRAFVEVCLAVELAHTRGIIHRDLKPENIMLGEFGEVFVLDWGVAKVLGTSDPELALPSSQDDALTQAGAIVGTRGYMAPEQATGAEVDARSDVYSLGCTLREILTGCHASAAPPLHDVPPELDELVEQATAFDSSARLASARALGERVQRYLDGDRDLALRRTLAGTHLERANAALASGDERVAMVEGVRALALDPTLRGAADLVGRLMIQPPPEMPPEVVASIEAENREQTREIAKTGRVVYLLHGWFAIFVVLIGTRNWALVLTLFVTVVCLFATAWYGSRHPLPTRGISFRKLVTVVGNAITIGVYARFFSPFLIAPALATLVLITMFGSAAYRQRRIVIFALVAMSLGILVPWGTEVLGWISPTIDFNPKMLLIPDAIPPHPTFIKIALTIYIPVFLVAASLITLRRSRTETAAQARLQLQAWRLRQLINVAT